MLKNRRRTGLVGLLAAASLALTACSDADQVGSAAAGQEATLSGTLAGAGASSQTAAQEAWAAGFQSANPEVTVNYDSVGSGAGRDQFVAGDALGFAGSDAPLDDEELAAAQERCGPGGAVDLPVYISPIAVAYNLPGVEDLTLAPETVARIFDQKITTWDDPAIAADNPEAQLPDLAITPVNRQDESGTTENFTEYLVAAAGDAWPYEASGEWPVAGGEAADGTSGVVSALEAAEGAIGYADASQVRDLGVARVVVGGEPVELSAESAAAVVEASEKLEGRPEGDLALELARDVPGTYPIVLVSYAVVCTAYEDEAQGELVKAFLSYVVSEEGQAAAQEAAGAAPLSDALRGEIEGVVRDITAGAAS